MDQKIDTTVTPAVREGLKRLLIAAGLHGAEMAARGAAIYAIQGIPHYVMNWHRRELPDWLLHEPLTDDLVEESLARIAKYAWIQWRHRRIPDRTEFPNPPTPDWIVDYAERAADELAGQVSLLDKLREAGTVNFDGTILEPPGPAKDVVRSMFFHDD